jgi:ABC-type antimicrobial peptide transport system permease subunit
VIGVSQFIEYLPRKDIDLPPDPVVYVVTPNDGATVRRLLVRGDGVNGERGRAALSTVLQQEIHRQLPAEAEVPVRPWLDDYENQREMVGFLASIFGAFAGFGLVLCAVGLYGVLAYTVGRRLREFAVRIALGARRRDVMRLVLHDAAVTALGGVGIGAFIALAVTRSIVEGIGAFPYAAAIALVASELVLFGVAFIASLGPVRRAAQASPIEILRAN